MIIDLKNLFLGDESSINVENQFDFSDILIGTTSPFASQVTLEGRIFLKNMIVKIDCIAKYNYDAPCDRCGEQSVDARQTAISHILVTEQNAENDEFLLLPDMKLDLNELVLSDIILSLPYKHLCSTDCKGICVACGTNLNHASCKCGKQEIDPRLSKLKELL